MPPPSTVLHGHAADATRHGRALGHAARHARPLAACVHLAASVALAWLPRSWNDVLPKRRRRAQPRRAARLERQRVQGSVRWEIDRKAAMVVLVWDMCFVVNEIPHSVMKLHFSLSNGRPFTSFTFTIQPIHRCHLLRRSGQPIGLRGPAVEPFHFLVGGSFGIPVALGPNLDQNLTTRLYPLP